MLPPNTILQNRYRVLRELGHGGMGTVYEALDQRVKCNVALKETLATDHAETRKAFEREAALLANLRHPALPKVMDYFSEHGSDFLVMEFIPGYDLAELLDLTGGPIPESQVMRWAIDILGVLEYLHGHEPAILHRDIKPSNLKLTKQGEVFLLDFGVAKGSVGPMSSLATNRSVRAYTPAYASLEQVLGLGTDVRSDIYSLGATLYHLLAGAAPIDAPTRFQTIEDEGADPLQSIEKLNPDASRNVASVIYQAMAVSRKQRLTSASDMRKALLKTVVANERKSPEENSQAEVTRGLVPEHVSAATVNAREFDNRAPPEIKTLPTPPPDIFLLDQLSLDSKQTYESLNHESAEEYEWHCSDCGGVIDRADESCPHCGSETTQIVDNSDEESSRTAVPTNEGGMAFLDKLVEILPQHPFGYFNRGLARYHKRDLDGAIADYNKVIEIDPQDADAYVNRALACSSKGDHDAAINDCNKAIEIGPQQFRAYACRGMARYDKGDLNGAIVDCSKAIEIDPTFALAYASRGAAKLRQGEDGEAQEDFDSALKLDDSMRAGLQQWINDIKRARKLGLRQRISRLLKSSTKWHK